MSQGGSSLIANWIIVAMLLQISHQARKPRLPVDDSAPIANLADEDTQVLDLRAIGEGR